MTVCHKLRAKLARLSFHPRHGFFSPLHVSGQTQEGDTEFGEIDPPGIV